MKIHFLIQTSKLGLGFLFISFLLVCLGCGQSRPTMRIMVADALNHSFRKLKDDFLSVHPNCEIILECQGSLTLCRLAALRPSDLIAVADARLVKTLLGEKEADWVLPFASTSMVLIRSEFSKEAVDLSSDQWLEILLRPKVTLGLADPRHDPCGYFTLLSWQLAQKHFSKPGLSDTLRSRCPPGAVACDALQLLARLQAGVIDYAFAYECLAKDMRLPYIALPDEINLGNEALRAEYEKASVKVDNALTKGRRQYSGTVISFGLTIPRSARNPALAQAFIEHLLSARGQAILKNSGLRVLSKNKGQAWRGKLPVFGESTK